MRILYHHRTMADGAEGIHISEMVNAFRTLGHDVQVIGPAVSGRSSGSTGGFKFSRIKCLAGHPVYELLELAYNFYGYRLVMDSLVCFKPHLIYDRYILFNYSCIAAGRRHRIPVFLEVNAPLAYERDHEPDEFLYLKKIAYALEKIICSRADKTIVVSTPLKGYLTSVGVPENKILVLPNGVNPKSFSPRLKSRILMNKLGLRDSNIIVGFVGILRPWHGLDMLLEAFKIVHDLFPTAILLLVGDGPIERDIESRAGQLGLKPHLRITGRVPHYEINEYIALFDLSVCAKTTFYASPMKILEYMAQGKAVVAPDSTNVRDIIHPEVDGILFQPGSPVSLAAGMLRLIADESLRNRIRKAALCKTSCRLNWIFNAQRIIDEFKKINHFSINGDSRR